MMAGSLIHCKVQRRPCIGWSYFHHFIVLNINELEMVVAHYTNTFPVLAGIAESAGEFVIDKFVLDRNKPNQPCDLLDFSKGVFIVTPVWADLLNPRDAIIRLMERLYESKYNVTTNNCEHVVNYILCETPLENQADTQCCRSNIVGGLVHNIKNVGIKIVLLIPFLGALLASSGGGSHVEILASAFYFYTTNQGADICVLSETGQNAIDHIQAEILEVRPVLEDILKKHNYTYYENVTVFVSNMLNNPFVCEAANSISNTNTFYILTLSIFVPLSIEWYLSWNVYVYYVGTLLGKSISRVLRRDYIVQASAWVLANITIGGFGYIILTYAKNPYVWFFVTYILLGVVLRFGFTMLCGCIYDMRYGEHRKQWILKPYTKRWITFWGVFFPSVCLAFAITLTLFLTANVL